MSEPLNYPVTRPDGSVEPRYPVTSTLESAYEHPGEPKRGSPASSAHAYIDYIEGCLAEASERIGALELRLRTLEQGHADLVTAFHRRMIEFESRLDRVDAIISPAKT